MISITIDIAKQKLAALQSATSAIAAVFYAGNHWNGGKDYIGPGPSSGDSSYTEAMAVIGRSFTFRNQIAEFTDRHIGGVIGKPPHWKYSLAKPLDAGEKPNESEASLMREAESAQVKWLDDRSEPFDDGDNADPLTIFCRNLLVYGRSVMRMFVPSAEIQDGLIPAGDMAQSLDRIWFQAVPPTMAGVLRHHDTMQWYGVYIYTLQEGDPGKEMAVEYMELCQVDKVTKLTNVQLFREAELINEMNLDLGGRLTIYEARRPALITDDVLSIQRALNMILTIHVHAIQSAGSPGKVLLNASLPGKFMDIDGARRYVPDGIDFGAGTLNNFIGREIKNADGSVSYANPDIRFQEPVNVTTFVQSELAYTKHMYERVNQAHVLITSDATASATSRRQALADYSSSVDVTATVIDGMFRWLLESSLRLASVFANMPKRFEGLRSAAKCRLNIGPVDVEMLRILSELRDSGFVSHEFALSESGLVDDVDSELQRVTQEQEVKQAADMEIQEQETSMLMKVKGAINGNPTK